MWEELSQIKKMRQKLGLTQTELANLSGVSQSLIAKIEKGRVEPSYSVARRIFLVLEKRMNETHEIFKAEDICTREIISISPEDSVRKALDLMRNNDISQLPVIENSRVVGSITETTLISNYDRISERTMVKEIMDEPFPVISSTTPLPLVREMLKVYPAVLVVSKGELRGIITKADLLKEKILRIK